MNLIEARTVLKLWSTKKEFARVHFDIEESKLPKSRLFEMKIVYFLSMLTKQIEIVDQEGNNILISFRKYPEIYTLEDLNPLNIISNFEYEDFKRDVCKIIPDLYVKTSI